MFLFLCELHWRADIFHYTNTSGYIVTKTANNSQFLQAQVNKLPIFHKTTDLFLLKWFNYHVLDRSGVLLITNKNVCHKYFFKKLIARPIVKASYFNLRLQNVLLTLKARSYMLGYGPNCSIMQALTPDREEFQGTSELTYQSPPNTSQKRKIFLRKIHCSSSSAKCFCWFQRREGISQGKYLPLER